MYEDAISWLGINLLSGHVTPVGDKIRLLTKLFYCYWPSVAFCCAAVGQIWSKLPRELINYTPHLIGSLRRKAVKKG